MAQYSILEYIDDSAYESFPDKQPKFLGIHLYVIYSFKEPINIDLLAQHIHTFMQPKVTINISFTIEDDGNEKYTVYMKFPKYCANRFAGLKNKLKYNDVTPVFRKVPKSHRSLFIDNNNNANVNSSENNTIPSTNVHINKSNTTTKKLHKPDTNKENESDAFKTNGKRRNKEEDVKDYYSSSKKKLSVTTIKIRAQENYENIKDFKCHSLSLHNSSVSNEEKLRTELKKNTNTDRGALKGN